MKTTLVIVLALLTGCAGPTIFVDSRFTSEEQQQIQAAGDEWNRATSGHADIQLAFGFFARGDRSGKRVIVRRSGPAPASANGAVTDAHTGFHKFLGVTLDEQMDVFVDQLAAEGTPLQTAVQHELGHSVGIGVGYGDDGYGHTNERNAVMYPVAKGVGPCVGVADLRLYCEANDCGVTRMHPCDRGKE